METLLKKSGNYLVLVTGLVKCSDYYYTNSSNLIRRLEDFPEEEVIKDSDGKIIRFSKRDHLFVIAHLPLNNAEILLGVDLLPEFPKEKQPISFDPTLIYSPEDIAKGSVTFYPSRFINTEGNRVLKGNYYYSLF